MKKNLLIAFLLTYIYSNAQCWDGLHTLKLTQNTRPLKMKNHEMKNQRQLLSEVFG